VDHAAIVVGRRQAHRGERPNDAIFGTAQSQQQDPLRIGQRSHLGLRHDFALAPPAKLPHRFGYGLRHT
jgi:hypothetical protein